MMNMSINAGGAASANQINSLLDKRNFDDETIEEDQTSQHTS